MPFTNFQQSIFYPCFEYEYINSLFDTTSFVELSPKTSIPCNEIPPLRSYLVIHTSRVSVAVPPLNSEYKIRWRCLERTFISFPGEGRPSKAKGHTHRSVCASIDTMRERERALWKHERLNYPVWKWGQFSEENCILRKVLLRQFRGI